MILGSSRPIGLRWLGSCTANHESKKHTRCQPLCLKSEPPDWVSKRKYHLSWRKQADCPSFGLRETIGHCLTL